MSPEPHPATMPFLDLEDVYERLALAIDQAGHEKSDVFLTKLVLKLAAETDDKARVLAAIEACLVNL